jgi:hypothetical protein
MSAPPTETLFVQNNSCRCDLVVTRSVVWFVDRNHGAETAVLGGEPW